MVTDSQLTTLRLIFKPIINDNNKYFIKREHTEESLILYSNFFVLLLDEMGRIELRYLTTITVDDNNDHYKKKQKFSKEVTRVIGSRDVELNKWNELIITDASVDLINEDKENYYLNQKKDIHNNDIDVVVNKIILVTPEKINTSSNENGELFVGGLPNNNNNVNSTPLIKTTDNNNNNDNNKLLGMKSFNHGFIGCIKEFSINDRIYNWKSDFNGDVLDGFDIGKSWKIKIYSR